MINYKDYYSILGVAKEATADEIRKAYRKLAVKYHPDKTKGDTAAGEKFKEINEANQVLADPEKRKKYDRFGADWKHYEDAGEQPGGFDWSKYAGDGGTKKQRMSADEFESMFAAGDEIDLFELLFGERGGRRQGRRSAAFKGDDLNAEATISLEEAYHGSARLIRLDSQTIRVTVPPGIGNEQVLRIAGKGMAGVNGGPKGDLYLTVKIASHPEFHRKGDDLHRDFPVELYTAVLGGKALVKTLKGAVKVDVPKETPNHKVLRLRGLGMPVASGKNIFGDLFVTVDIRLPDHLTPEEMDLFGKLAAIRK
ncbi:MAG: J domain-containing protein [Chitinispirillaceae bacterium]|nr:J domain-containing protein [Chitinispirillaceae bacterium]